MRHQFHPILILLCCGLTGCAALNPLSLSSNRHPIPTGDLELSASGFNLNDPVERQKALKSIDHELIKSELANLRRGSRINIVVEFDRRVIGTVVSTSKGSVELMNCLCKEVVTDSDGRKLCKTSHIPIASFQISSMSLCSPLSSPPRGYTSQEFEEERRDVNIETVVLLNGRRQSLAIPSPESSQDIGAIPMGTQISIVDEFHQRYNGILLSTGPDRIELMNCVWQERAPGPRGESLHQTSHVPFQSFQTSSIRSYGIIASARPNFAPPEHGDCYEYCLAGFTSQSGRYHNWGVSPEQSPSEPGIASVND